MIMQENLRRDGVIILEKQMGEFGISLRHWF